MILWSFAVVLGHKDSLRLSGMCRSSVNCRTSRSSNPALPAGCYTLRKSLLLALVHLNGTMRYAHSTLTQFSCRSWIALAALRIRVTRVPPHPCCRQRSSLHIKPFIAIERRRSKGYRHSSNRWTGHHNRASQIWMGKAQGDQTRTD